VLIALAAILAFALGSMVYVYRYRGATRYASRREYVRKAWPVFAPLNCLLYAFTQQRARRVFMDLGEFPELDAIQRNWRTIRDEGMHLYEKGYFDKTTDPASPAYFDIGFRTFYKYGWSKFYLKWYGYTHASAQVLCPNTTRLLKDIDSVNGAMFSLLPPGSQLTRHTDPLAISLRYHLGLSTPNSEDCYIDVDGQRHSWRDGDAALFDITYLHYARNDSEAPRLILMCDVERPLNLVGRFINFLYKGIARLTVVPNIEGDRRGLANRIFASVAPVFARTKSLKKTNRRLYNVIKYTFNGLLLAILALILLGVVRLVQFAVT
jgi:beta-hydroxylase